MIERIIKCPTCGKSTVYSLKNEFRPFCSEACQTRDLGAWASGQHAILGDPVESNNEVNQNPEDDEEDPGFPRQP